MRKFDGRIKKLEGIVKALYPDEYPFILLKAADDGKSVIVSHEYANYSGTTRTDTLKTVKELEAYFKDRTVLMLFLGGVEDVEIIPGSLAHEVFNEDLGMYINFNRAIKTEI